MFRPQDIVEATEDIWTERGLIPKGDYHVVEQVSEQMIRVAGVDVFVSANRWDLAFRPGAEPCA